MQSRVLLDYEFAVSSQEYVVRALLSLEGHAPENASRIPLNLSLVLDRSGSMSGEKLAAARSAAALLVRRLHPEDTVSVVTYDDQVQTLAPPATGAEQADLSRQIRAIQSGSTTNLSGGWLRGRDHVAENLRERASNRVILLTDGLANVGITDPGQLIGLCRTARQHGITTTTIGFGADYNEHLLRSMAEAGGGHTYYIERPDQAAGIFTEEIEDLLTLSAQNVTVEVRPTEATQLTVVHHEVPRTDIPGGVRLELGDLYAREPKRLLVEFLVPDSEPAEEVQIAELVITAHVLTSEGGVERQVVRLPIHLPLSREGHVEPEIRREMLLVETARAREEALRDQARGDYRNGHMRLSEMAARCAAWHDPADLEIQEEARDLEQMARQFGEQNVSMSDAKYLHQRAWNRYHQKPGSTRRISRSRGPVPGGGARIAFRVGDATRPEGPGRKLIAHVCDVEGSWGEGFTRSLSRRWPELEVGFRSWQRGELPDAPPFALGNVYVERVSPEIWVAHMLAKQGTHIRHGMPALRYDALDIALAQVADEALMLGVSVHMPRIGCEAAGGRWEEIEPLIESNLGGQGVPVTIYDLTPQLSFT